MTTPGQKVRFVGLEELKDKYHHRGDRITSMCKAISRTLQTKIFVSVARNGTVRFEIVGQRIKQASQYIQDEFCTQKTHAVKFLQRGQLSQAALQVLKDEDQEKLLREGNPFLLTEEALRRHNILTGALELREFACEDCDRVWWKTVLCTKPVSKCFNCKTKYDALPREKEFGIGRYRCMMCKHSFFSRCEATSERPCFNCDFTVRAPYIHPKFKPTRRKRPQIDPTMIPYTPPEYKKYPYIVHDPSQKYALPVLFYIPLPRKPRKKVVNASTVHDPTGSTASTFITQIELPASLGTETSEDVVPVVILDPESDDENIIVCNSSSDSDSVEELSENEQSACTSDVETTAGAMAGSGSSSDSDAPHSKGLRKRSAASESSDSDSDSDSEQDRGKKTPKAPSIRSSAGSRGTSGKNSTQSSTKDSGLGTAGSLDTESLALTRSTLGSDQGARPSIKLGSVASFNPTDYPGVVFSKFCAKQAVDCNGGTIVGEGIELNVPENAIQPGDSVEIELQGCLGGPFKFPNGITPVSPVYRIAPPFVFHREVTLKIEHFAVLESPDDCEDIVFISSPTKPKIRKHKETPCWKFRIYSHPECASRSRYGIVRLTHFCFGALGRQLRRGQRKHYYVSLYSPLSYIPPRCDAIFSVSLYQPVYVNNLERYLKEFESQEFKHTYECVKSIENEIELKIPTDMIRNQRYKIVTYKKCQIRKSAVEYALENKRHTTTDITTYPPRIQLTLCHLENPSPESALECQLEISGVKEVPYFTLYVPRYSQSETSSQRSTSFEGTDDSEQPESEHILQMEDHKEVTDYLRDLNEDHCISLGGALGLTYTNLNRMKRYPEDVVAAWLRKEDNVIKHPPTWHNLVRALEKISQNGIAYEVRGKHLPL